jgi:hypothetical protein
MPKINVALYEVEQNVSIMTKKTAATRKFITNISRKISHTKVVFRFSFPSNSSELYQEILSAKVENHAQKSVKICFDFQVSIELARKRTK